MEDGKIITLFFQRSEQAIAESRMKFGKLIYSIAYHILYNHSDAEECENDTYLGAWNTIPPVIPRELKAYFLKIARNQALKKYHHIHSQKRDVSLIVPLDELQDSLPNGVFMEEDEELSEFINLFLKKLNPDCRKVFLLRYWYFASVKEIMAECGMSKSKVESMLFRTRNCLKKEILQKGGCHGRIRCESDFEFGS